MSSEGKVEVVIHISCVGTDGRALFCLLFGVDGCFSIGQSVLVVAGSGPTKWTLQALFAIGNV